MQNLNQNKTKTLETKFGLLKIWMLNVGCVIGDSGENVNIHNPEKPCPNFIANRKQTNWWTELESTEKDLYFGMCDHPCDRRGVSYSRLFGHWLYNQLNVHQVRTYSTNIPNARKRHIQNTFADKMRKMQILWSPPYFHPFEQKSISNLLHSIFINYINHSDITFTFYTEKHATCNANSIHEWDLYDWKCNDEVAWQSADSLDPKGNQFDACTAHGRWINIHRTLKLTRT